MALRGKPTQGPKMSFWAPLPASKEQANAAIENDQTFARVLCKDAIGAFLGLVRAQPRISTFGEGNPDVENLNEGARFSINEQVGEKQYILTLKPGTAVMMGRYDWSTEAAPTAVPVFMKTLQLFVPGHVTVWQMKRWISKMSPNVLLENGVSPPLEGFPFSAPGLYTNIADNYSKIISITSPNGRKTNLRSILYPDALSPIQ
jgi:hypothetical protein